MKPKCKFSGENDNIFNLLAIASKVLNENERREQAEEMQKRVFECESYQEAIKIIGEYVEIY